MEKSAAESGENVGRRRRRKASYSWPDKLAIKLIEFVEQAPFVYDASDEDHIDSVKTWNFWTSVADELSSSAITFTGTSRLDLAFLY